MASGTAGGFLFPLRPPPLPLWHGPCYLLAGMDAVNTLLKQVLDGTTARNRALANNIANATTAGYRRRDVEFLTELKSAMKGEHGQDVESWKPSMKTSRREIPIRLEKEFALLAENQLLYQTTAEVLSRRYAGLRAAILGRR